MASRGSASPLDAVLDSLPMPLEVPAAQARSGVCLGEECPPALRRRLEDGAVVMFLGRSSSSGGHKSRLACVTQVRTAARRLARYGIDVRDAIPPDAALLGAQRTAASLTLHDRAGKESFAIRVTLVRVSGLPVIITMITGSGAQLDENFQQPAIATAAAVMLREQPFLTVVPELARVGRDPWAFADPARAFQRLAQEFQEPAWLGYEDQDKSWDPDAMRLEPFSGETEVRLFEAGRKGRAEAARFYSRSVGGALTHAEKSTVMVAGRASWPAGPPPLPGLATVRMASDAGRRGETKVIVDAPWALPEPHEVLWGLPAVYDAENRHVDQWETLKWLFENAYTPPWNDERLIGAELERRQFSWEALRRSHDDSSAARFRNKGTRCHKLLALIFKVHLDAYFHRQIALPLPAGQTPVTITGLPWALSESSYDRISRRWRSAVRTRERTDTYLFTGAPVYLVDDQAPGVLVGSRRRKTGETIYLLRETGSPGRLGGRDRPVPPIPEQKLLEATLATLTRECGTFSAPTIQEPVEVRRLRAWIAEREPQIAQLREDQKQREPYIDPARVSSLRARGEDPDVIASVAATFVREAKRLRALDAAQRDDIARLESREAQLLAGGIPVDDLWGLVRAYLGTPPPGLRHALLDSLTGPIQVRRPVGGNGATPLHPPSFEFGFQFHDPAVGTREARIHGEYATSWQLNTARDIHRFLELLAAGVSAREQGVAEPWQKPLLRQALGSDRSPRALYIVDPRILQMTMAVCHPLRPVEECTPGRSFARPVLTDDQVGQLACERDWAPALLHRIRWIHVENTRLVSLWVHRSAPKTAALYARGRRGRVHLTRQEKPWLMSDRTSGDWQIDGWVATLLPCAQCGSRRIHPTRLLEATFGVCGKCRHDRAGVPWGKAYDLYIE